MQVDVKRAASRAGIEVNRWWTTGKRHDQPVEATLPPRIAISDLTIPEQIAYYRSRLAIDQTRRIQSAPALAAQASEYAAAANQVYQFGDRKVNIFAPFVTAQSALQTVTTGQRRVMIVLGLILLLAFAIDLVATSVAIMALLMLFYSGNLLLTFWLSVRTLEHSQEIQIPDEVVHALADADWPRYTILCPLYRETEVVEQFARAMSALDYPIDKLQILFLTEEDDEPTREAIRAAKLPEHFQIVTVPDGQPRTKPRACNYGLLQATGDYLVIYDAEDVPDPLQLKKAVLAFYSRDSGLGCVQAKLNFYNSDQNILTRLFTAEYSTWFEMTLPGLQVGRFSIPLGGTSNHFPVSVLREVGGWDAYNVTEDCDLGLRLAAHHLNTVVLDSTTYEEANPRVRNWIRQRSRWIKGYFQTYLVHMRNPRRYLDRSRLAEFLSLQLIIGGRTLVLLINPLMWLTLTIYILFRPYVQPAYETLFPAPVLYMAVICLIMGNLMYIYIHFTGCLKRRQYDLIKWALLLPLYWMLGSYAAFKALGQLITKPHHWEKTTHGLHLNHASANGTAAVPVNGHEAPNGHVQAAAGSVLASAAVTSTNGRVSNGDALAYGSGGGVDLAALARIPARTPFWQRVPADGWLTATLVTACIASLAATLYFLVTNQILLYKDSSSHLGMARMLFDNIRPGFAHLGGVWLPLPHLAMMPFSMVDYLWRTGLAGACVSVPSYVITALYIFLSIRQLTRHSMASYIGALVFMLNPNVLYLQATPLTEPLAAATITAACYHLLVWIQEEKPLHLLVAAAATFLATLARYDGWALFMGFLALIPLITLMKRRQRYQVEANTIIFGLLGGLGIAIWILWCALILGDPLYWQRSEYSSQGQHEMLIQQNRLYTYHNVPESIRYFTVLTAVTMGPVMFALSVAGVIIFVARKRISAETLGGLTFLIPFAFYIFSLYSGQVSINLPELVPPDAPDKYFNSRFGIVGVVPGAVFFGVLAAWVISLAAKYWSSHRPTGRAVLRYGLPAVFVLGIVGQSVVTVQNGVVALQDGQFGRSCQPPQKIVDYMARYYGGGRILLDTFSNSSLYLLGPVAGIEFKNIIYEGTASLWEQALEDPAAVVDWIVLNPQDPHDKVAAAIDVRSPRFLAQFLLVVEEEEGARGLYRRITLPPTPERPIRQDVMIANHQCSGY